MEYLLRSIVPVLLFPIAISFPKLPTLLASLLAVDVAIPDDDDDADDDDGTMLLELFDCASTLDS